MDKLTRTEVSVEVTVEVTYVATVPKQERRLAASNRFVVFSLGAT